MRGSSKRTELDKNYVKKVTDKNNKHIGNYGACGPTAPVIAYKKNGWGPFSWASFKILDLVDCDDKEKGMWETYIPVHHLMNWNIVKK